MVSERTKVTAARLDKFLANRGIANASGDPDLDIALVKATNHDEVAPKEKHVRTIKTAVSMGKTTYVLGNLTKRLYTDGRQDWLTSLKVLIIFHRLMREQDKRFTDDFVRFEQSGQSRLALIRLEDFTDHSLHATWDSAAWIRVYSVYLDDRKNAYKILG